MSIEFVGMLILSLVLAVVLAGYDRMMRKMKSMKSVQEEVEMRARDRAMKLVEEARDKAMRILNEAKMELAGNEDEWKKKLARVEMRQVEMYKEMLKGLSKTLESEAIEEIADFKKVLEMEVGGVQQSVAKRLEEQYKAAMEQLEEYKKTKMGELDARAEDVLKEFLRLGVVKNLSLEGHRELIKEALEEARKANAY